VTSRSPPYNRVAEHRPRVPHRDLAAGREGAGRRRPGPNLLPLANAELFSSAADLTAQLVADSTGKGPGKALADKATTIQTAVNAGQTATACAGITDYLGLVKAQTGKKLTIAQANQLTTDATDLAAALGC